MNSLQKINFMAKIVYDFLKNVLGILKYMKKWCPLKKRCKDVAKMKPE